MMKSYEYIRQLFKARMEVLWEESKTREGDQTGALELAREKNQAVTETRAAVEWQRE